MTDRDQIVVPDDVRYEPFVSLPEDAFAESYHAFRDAILSSFGVPRHVLLGEPPPMTPEQAFMQAIIENPDDDTPRLVYADWLEEHDQQERAEFIRVQIELAKMPEPEAKTFRPLIPGRSYHEGEGVCVRCSFEEECRYHVLRRREKELLDEWGWAWVPVCIQEISPDRSIEEFRRGFIAEITLSCADWLAHRERLLKAAPLERVTLTHLPHFSPQDTVCLRRGQSLYLSNEFDEVMDLSFPASRLTAPSR